MVRKAALALALAATPAWAQTDSPFLNWVHSNSPYGFDLTPDGSIWINIAEPGERDDYAILATDLMAARESKQQSRTIWVRGYHKLNPKVPYRQTKALWRVDCTFKTISRVMWVSYDGNMDTLSEYGATMATPVVPGSYGAEYFRQACLVK